MSETQKPKPLHTSQGQDREYRTGATASNDQGKLPLELESWV